MQNQGLGVALWSSTHCRSVQKFLLEKNIKIITSGALGYPLPLQKKRETLTFQIEIVPIGEQALTQEAFR